MTADGDATAPRSDSGLTLTTLGVVALESARGSAPLLTPGKPLAMVTYLALAPRRTARREHLVDLLWADLAPDKARHALRQTIWYLRQLLGADCLTAARSGEIVLTLPLTTDRDQFLAALEAGELERAVGVYQGEFLAGFAAPGGVEFEHWADVERQRLRSAFLRAAETLARRCMDQGHFRDAQELARRARDAARSSEAAWRLLLECHAAGGDQLGFTMEASGLSQMLTAEQREPEPATRLLLSRGRENRPEAAPGSSLSPALVGREREFATIIAAWESVTRHAGRHVHLSAPAGLGKSRLFADIHRRFRGLGTTVVTLRANPGDRAIPYSYLSELARALTNLPGAIGVSPASASSLVALNPVLSTRFAAQADSATGGEALRRRAAALTELLTAVTEEQPCALLLDDLHWADAASRQALRPLLDRVGDLRALILTAARPIAEAGIAGESAQVMVLAPLTVAQTGELLASLGQIPEAQWSLRLAEDLTRATGGSPLLLLETLQLAVDRGWLGIRDGSWRCDRPAQLAQALREGSAMQHRVSNLDELGRRLLVILAVAGMPVSLRQLSRATTVPERILDDALAGLEHRGLVHRSGDLALPAHDEIAAAALEVATTDSIPSVHAGIATALLEGAEVEPHDLVRAGRHLDLGGRKTEVVGVFARYLVALRRRGDPRRVGEIAYEFLGEGASLPEVLRLVRRLPVWARFSLSSGRVAVLALLFLGAGVAVLAPVARHPPPEAVLLIRDRTAADTSIHRLEIRESDWHAGAPIPLPQLERQPLPFRLPLEQAVPSPDGRRWLLSREHPRQPETYDVYLRDSTGAETRLTRYRGDDYYPTWTPDGRGFTWLTSQWSPPGEDNYDLAYMDLQTRQERRLTSGRPADRVAFFSPDGTRLLFHRTYDDRVPETCWMPQDASAPPACFAIPGFLVLDAHGWIDEARVLLTVDSAGTYLLVRYDPETGGVRVLHRYVKHAWLSPDRRWLAVVLARPREAGQFRLLVHPIDDPARAREVTGVTSLYPELVWLPQARAPRDYLDSVEIVPPPRNVIRSDAAYRFKLRLWAAGGSEIHGSATPVWSVSDTSVLTVDTTGLARPRRPGPVTVQVDVGGWRQGRLRTAVVPARDSFILQEGWERGIEAHWIPFGEPRPFVTEGPWHGPAFNNNGDGSYTSGAYSRDHWDASEGLGVEATISVHLTRSQGQVLTLDWVGGLDSLSLGDWDHLSSFMPLRGFLENRLCAVGYPAGEGLVGKLRLSHLTGPWAKALPVDSALADGHTFQLRLQLFPDGRCGLALDGRPVSISDYALPLDLPFAVRLGYSAYQGRVLHGPIQVWRGVRDDVQWELLQSPAEPAAASSANRRRSLP